MESSFLPQVRLIEKMVMLFFFFLIKKKLPVHLGRLKTTSFLTNRRSGGMITAFWFPGEKLSGARLWSRGLFNSPAGEDWNSFVF